MGQTLSKLIDKLAKALTIFMKKKLKLYFLQFFVTPSEISKLNLYQITKNCAVSYFLL